MPLQEETVELLDLDSPRSVALSIFGHKTNCYVSLVATGTVGFLCSVPSTVKDRDLIFTITMPWEGCEPNPERGQLTYNDYSMTIEEFLCEKGLNPYEALLLANNVEETLFQLLGKVRGVIQPNGLFACLWLE